MNDMLVGDGDGNGAVTGTPLHAPFPYFGGKSRIAAAVWRRLGNVANYIEPFFGSGAVLLARPHAPGIETINDKCGYVANFWRAVAQDPEAVASYVDWPVNENDLHARHVWLISRRDELQARLEADPDWCDAKIAGWWCWGMCCWIGSGFCSGAGPWRIVDGQLVRGDAGRGVSRTRPHLGNAGEGVQRRLPHLTHAGRGVSRLDNPGQMIYAWMHDLAARLRRIRVCCGDWSRICGPGATLPNGLTGVFLDPPYSAEAGREGEIYRCEDLTVAHAVREWAIAHGNDRAMRIALCGYEGEYAMPADWEELAWKTQGGYGNLSGAPNANAARERIWFSPHCLRDDGLFAGLA